MKCIDFDHEFMHYAEKWMAENRGKFKNADEMEAQMPDVYLRWLNQSAEWLDGRTPGGYFQAYDDVNELIDWMEEYHRQQVDVPNQLMERIVELGEGGVERLMALARDPEADSGLRVTALNLLNEIGSRAPMEMCMDLIENRAETDEMADVAAELLTNLGRVVVEPVLQRMERSSRDAKETFLDVLCNFPGDERIYNYAESAFRNRPERRALFASYLAKLGDERAIEILRPALQYVDLGYLDYIEIRNAIEALGGEVEEEREFFGDPDYESMRSME